MHDYVMVAGGSFFLFKHTPGLTVLIPSTMASLSALLDLWDGNPRIVGGFSSQRVGYDWMLFVFAIICDTEC